MKISTKSKYVAVIILLIVVSTLAYGIGTLRGYFHKGGLDMTTNTMVTVMTTLNFLDYYHSENNKKLEQMLDLNLHTYTGALLSITKHEFYKKEPVAVKIFARNIGPEYQQIQDVIKKQLTRVAEYRRENTSEWLAGSEEMYKLLMTYLPKDSVSSTKE